MKKNYFLLAASTMMFAACAQTDMVNEVVTEEAPQAIGFETFANKATRGLISNKLEEYHDGFGVWAYKGDKGSETTPVMENYNVVYESGDWVYDGQTGGTSGSTAQILKYWDKLKAYKFFAYAPYNKSVKIVSQDIQISEGEYAANQNLVGATLTTAENTTAKFTGTGENVSSLTADKKVTTDWMIAGVKNPNKGENGTVEEEFTHTLSRLVVNLKTTSGETITINSVSVNDVFGIGSYSSGKWTVDNDDKKNIAGATGTLTGNKTTSPVHYCMEYLVIPSTVPPTFSINYTVNGDDYDVSGLSIDGLSGFSANTSYTLTVTIGLNPIEFEVTEVNGWTPGSITEATSGDVTIQ